MTIRHNLSPEAKRDIEQIRDCYRKEAGARVAHHVPSQITSALRFLAETALSAGTAGILTQEIGDLGNYRDRSR